MKGGYKIIDLQNQNLTIDTPITLRGVYESIENSYHKPLLLSGIIIDNIDKNDIYITPILDNTNYTLDLYGYNLTITQDDLITLEEKEYK